jgi:hypothetical protein
VPASEADVVVVVVVVVVWVVVVVVVDVVVDGAGVAIPVALLLQAEPRSPRVSTVTGTRANIATKDTRRTTRGRAWRERSGE